MTFTFTLLWWHLGAGGLAAGILAIIAFPSTYSEFMGWPSYDPSPPQVAGLFLAVISMMYLISGVIARSFA